MFPNVGELLSGVLEAKNELFHLCTEVEVTGASPPTLDDLIRMIEEDVMGLVSSPPTVVADTNGRKLHAAQVFPHGHRRRALRAHHLPYNHFTRPQRLLQESVLDMLLDSLSVTGGYDGTMFFIEFELDISKQFETSTIEELLAKPLDLLNEVQFLKDLFPSSASDQAGGLSFNLEVSVSASAHASILFGFELTGTEFSQVFTFDTNEIASRSFVQLKDMSAKFLLSSAVSGGVSIPGVAGIEVENGAASLGLGLGIDQMSERIYFNNITSMALMVRNNASWQKGNYILLSKYARYIETEPVLT